MKRSVFLLVFLAACVPPKQRHKPMEENAVQHIGHARGMDVHVFEAGGRLCVVAERVNAIDLECWGVPQ